MGSLSQVVSSSILESLPTRPPTPPKETTSHGLDARPEQIIASQQKQLSLRPSLHTPPGVSSPISATSSTSRRKRVGFSSQPEYQEPPTYRDTNSARHPTPVSVPSSSSKPIKSILKATPVSKPHEPADGIYLDGGNSDQVNIAAMLESTVQQLAGADRPSKMDAYTMLFRALKASNNLPDRIALQDKMGLFMQFIQRDITSKTDTPLVICALNLLNTFLHFGGIASSIPHEAGVFVIDHCIRSLEDEDLPKDIVRRLMQVIALQNFGSEVMTMDRIGRLVAALHNIENHIRGKSIIIARIIIYRKLIKQCQHQMVYQSDWLQDLFVDMVSSIPEIRSAAIEWGLEAAFSLNRDKKLTGQVSEILNTSLDDKKYVEHLTEQLAAMLQNPQQSASVPQIWSIVTLLIPCPDQWDLFRTWFMLLQNSFNNPDNQTKREAHLAWCRFAYRIHLDGGHWLDKGRHHEGRGVQVITLLGQALSSQALKRAKDLRPIALGNIMNTFYYVFKPDMNLSYLDSCWDLSVKPLMQKLLRQNSDKDHSAIVQAAAILTGLFDCKTRRVWKEDHIVNQPLVKTSELPAIDAKWIRRNSTRTFTLVDQILETTFSELSTPDSVSHKLWRALVGSVASASTKDIKLHDDTATFVAHVFNSLMNIWTKGPGQRLDGSVCSPSQFLNSTREMIRSLIEELGLLPNPFTEKPFSLTKQNTFKVSSAPARRTSKGQSLARLPLHHLFCLLSTLPPRIPDDEAFAVFLHSVFDPFFASKNVKGRMDLAQEVLNLLPVDAPGAYGPWLMLSKEISANLENSQHSHQSTGSGSEPPVGHQYREIVRVLERGLKLTPNLPWKHWHSLFRALCQRVRNETGDSGVAIAVIEPLAKAIKDFVLNPEEDMIMANVVKASIELVAASSHPRDKQAVDAARRRIWGTSTAGPRSPSFDPFDNLYKLVTSLLEAMYTDFAAYDSGDVASLINELSGFFDRCNQQLAFRCLMAVQAGLACWLEDKKHQITRTSFPDVHSATKALWQKCSIITDLPADQLQLGSVELLFCAAFRSTHRDIVSRTAEMWNRVYDNVDRIQYPEALEAVLCSLGASVEVTRPGLEMLFTDSAAHLPAFEESQEEPRLPAVSPTRPEQVAVTRPSSLRRSATPGSTRVSAIGRQQREATPLNKTSKSKRTSTAPKLRHDDSQIQFAAIQSSPSSRALESQLLTDRQREVKERQKETAVLFLDLRSSPGDQVTKADSASAAREVRDELPRQRAKTPEQDVDFEDYLTSTPTPRRGQPMMLPEQDQDMADPPSSPPEPRGYPLLAELKSKSNSNSVLDEWQFTSSPVSTSPIPAHDTVSASQPMELDEVDDGLQLDGAEDVAPDNDSAEAQPGHDMPYASSQSDVDLDIIEDSVIMPDPARLDTTLSGPGLPEQAGNEDPSTPSRASRMAARQGTPRSDHEEFVDARSSPLPPTPTQRFKASQAAGLRRSPRNGGVIQSFEASEVDERSMMRLVVQIESKKIEGVPSYDDILPESPENLPAKDPEVLDCITVTGGETKKRGRGRPRKPTSIAGSQANSETGSRRGSRVSLRPGSRAGSLLGSQDSPSIPVDPSASFGSQGMSQEDTPSGRGQKRKRSNSTGTGGKKRKQQEPEGVAEQVADSQALTAAQEMQTAGELYEKELSLSSIGASNSSSPIEEHAPQIASQVGSLPDESPDAAEQMYEEAIHSQLALEEEQAVSRAASPMKATTNITCSPMPAMAEVDTTVHEENDDEMIQGQTEQAMVAENPSTPAGDVGVEEPQTSKLNQLLGLLSGGMDVLKTAEFSREDVYKVEDMLMDMKRELYEAERRGRK